MNKQELSLVTRELRNGKFYIDADANALLGLGLDDFQIGKHISKEDIVMFLRWQCIALNGAIDSEELSTCLFLLKKKQIIMV